MFAILLSFIIITFVFLSIGDIFISIFSKIKKEDIIYPFIDTFLIGMCFTASLIAINSIWLPSDSTTLIILICISAFYWSIYRNRFKNIIQKYKRNIKEIKPDYILILPILAIFIIMIHGLTAPLWVDSPYYHYQNIMWNEQYAVVPGLANLQTRFGFNSNHFLLCSVFGLKPLFGQYIFGAQLSCLAYIFAWVLYKSTKSKTIVQAIIPLLMYISFIVVYKLHISSPSTDLLPNLLILYLFIKVIYDSDILKRYPLIFFCIPVFCLTLKLSAFPICLFSAYILWICIKNKEYSSVFYLLFCALFIFVPWCTRTVFLTGYIIYPFPAIDIFNFDWKVPSEYVIEQKDYIRDFAHGMTGSVSHDYLNVSISDRFTRWWQSGMFYYTPYANRIFFISSVPAIIVMVCLLFTEKRKKYTVLFSSWLVSLCGWIFWLNSAPDFRFAYGFIISLVFIPIIIIASYAKIHTKDKKTFILAISIIAILFVSLHTIRWVYFQRDEKQPSYTLMCKPISIEYTKRLKERQAKMDIDFKLIHFNNVELYEASYETHCYDCVLPCSSDYTGGLEMRGKTLQDGFKTREGKPHRRSY